MEEKEYPIETLKLMEEIRTKIFCQINIYDKRHYIKEILDSNNVNNILLIINGRTIQWIESEQIIFVTYSGITKTVNHEYIDALSLDLLSQPLYQNNNKLYAFLLDKNFSSNFQEVIDVKIADDMQTEIWFTEADGNGTIGIPTILNDNQNKIYGNNSLQIIPQIGDKSNWRIYRNYIREGEGPQNWTNNTFLLFYWLGANSTKIMSVGIGTVQDNWNNTLLYHISEDWFGWKKIVINLKNPSQHVGSPDLTYVTRIGFTMRNNVTGTRWIDKIALISTQANEH